MEIQAAQKSHARDLARLIDRAGEGLPTLLWRDMAESGETALETGARRAAREEGNFSYRNAHVAVEGESVLGMVLDYRQPDPYDTSDVGDYPALLQPLVRLEACAPGSWYINALATTEGAEGRGVARALLADSFSRGRAAGCTLCSIIVASENGRACRLYAFLGFHPRASQPVVPYDGGPQRGEWVLLTRPLGVA